MSKSMDRKTDGGKDAVRLRKEAGIWLKSLREAAGLSQRNVAIDIGASSYQVISQIESGKASVRPNQYERYAGSLGVNSADFVAKLLSYYDPYAYRLLLRVMKEPVVG